MDRISHKWNKQLLDTRNRSKTESDHYLVVAKMRTISKTNKENINTKRRKYTSKKLEVNENKTS